MTVGKATGGVGTVSFSSNGNSIMVSAGDHALRVWDTNVPSMAELDKRYDVDVERRKNRRQLLEIGREWRQ